MAACGGREKTGIFREQFDMNDSMPIEVASNQLHQALQQFTKAHDSAMSADIIGLRLSLHVALSAMQYVEHHGTTPNGRRQLRTGIAALRAAMGIDDESSCVGK